MQELIQMMAQKHTVLTVSQAEGVFTACLVNMNPKLSPQERVSVRLQGSLEEVSQNLLQALEQQISTPLVQKVVHQTPKAASKRQSAPQTTTEATEAKPADQGLDWEY